MRVLPLTLLLLACSPAVAQTTDDPYHLTENEKAACTDDAERLCANAYPDEKKLLACMKTNRSSLSATCLPVFDAGMKRRHL